MSEHTRAPWTASKSRRPFDQDRDSDYDDDGMVAETQVLGQPNDDGSFPLVATVYEQWPNTDGNAKVIAVAPEALAACRLVWEEFLARAPRPGITITLSPGLEAISHVIEKAGRR